MDFKISPQRVSWISLTLSVLAFFMLRIDVWYGIAWVIIVLVVDIGDGIMFRRHKLSRIDSLGIEVSHRLSEFLITYPNRIWILLTAMNVYLTIVKLKDKKIVVLPLRHIFLALLILKALNILPPSVSFLV